MLRSASAPPHASRQPLSRGPRGGSAATSSGRSTAGRATSTTGAPPGRFPGFRVEEELSTVGSATAVGRTGGVTGSLSIEDGTVTAASFSADLTTITTNDSRRDGKVHQALDVDTYPTATFDLTEPIALPPAIASGETITSTARGEVTIRDVTKDLSLPIGQGSSAARSSWSQAHPSGSRTTASSRHLRRSCSASRSPPGHVAESPRLRQPGLGQRRLRARARTPRAHLRGEEPSGWDLTDTS